MKAWVDEHGFEELTKFVSYVAKYHDDNALIHNDLVEMVDDAATTVRQLEVANHKLRQEITTLRDPQRSRTPFRDI